MRPLVKKMVKASLFLFNNREMLGGIIVFILGFKHLIHEDNFVQQLTDVLLVLLYFISKIFFDIEDD